jgi:photosynthetic reaction center cytochrome c subunit
MKIELPLAGALLGVAAIAVIYSTFTVPPVWSQQNGWRGTGMAQIATPQHRAALQQANIVPEVQPAADLAGEKSSDAYENVKVLGDVDSAEFLRIMTAITEWVAPEQGCSYCHAEGESLASDALYTKVVARRMIEMTLKINQGWKPHVAETGVTCYTCHRGQPVPANVWSLQTAANTPPYAGNKDKQNYPSGHVGAASLPNDIYAPYLSKAAEIRVESKNALPTGPNPSIQATEQTYGLMMHMSQGLGVNCTFCHNTQNFGEWSTSTPQRVTAWHGIRMMREINNTYIDTLANVFPANRKGPAGDVLKANCATCHAGESKPLYGVSMVKDYLELKAAPPR